MELCTWKLLFCRSHQEFYGCAHIFFNSSTIEKLQAHAILCDSIARRCFSPYILFLLRGIGNDGEHLVAFGTGIIEKTVISLRALILKFPLPSAHGACEFGITPVIEEVVELRGRDPWRTFRRGALPVVFLSLNFFDGKSKLLCVRRAESFFQNMHDACGEPYLLLLPGFESPPDRFPIMLIRKKEGGRVVDAVSTRYEQ